MKDLTPIQLRSGIRVKITTEAKHQQTQLPLNNMTGKVLDCDLEGDYIVAVDQLNETQLPFSKDELEIIE